MLLSLLYTRVPQLCSTYRRCNTIHSTHHGVFRFSFYTNLLLKYMLPTGSCLDFICSSQQHLQIGFVPVAMSCYFYTIVPPKHNATFSFTFFFKNIFFFQLQSWFVKSKQEGFLTVIIVAFPTFNTKPQMFNIFIYIPAL